MGAGAFWFGVVVGYITYRTLTHKATTGLSDIAGVIGAIGGAAVLRLFPVDTESFKLYAFGLAIGFFFYLLLSLAIGLKKGAAASRDLLGD